MDISSLSNINSNGIQKTNWDVLNNSKLADENSSDLFGSMLNSAIDNIRTTNSYMEDAQQEKVKLALGETENTHDLTIALQKASTALQYTVAVRDRFLEAYKEIMNMQI